MIRPSRPWPCGSGPIAARCLGRDAARDEALDPAVGRRRCRGRRSVAPTSSRTRSTMSWRTLSTSSTAAIARVARRAPRARSVSRTRGTGWVISASLPGASRPPSFQQAPPQWGHGHYANEGVPVTVRASAVPAPENPSCGTHRDRARRARAPDRHRGPCAPTSPLTRRGFLRAAGVTGLRASPPTVAACQAATHAAWSFGAAQLRRRRPRRPRPQPPPRPPHRPSRAWRRRLPRRRRRPSHRRRRPTPTCRPAGPSTTSTPGTSSAATSATSPRPSRTSTATPAFAEARRHPRRRRRLPGAASRSRRSRRSRSSS